MDTDNHYKIKAYSSSGPQCSPSTKINTYIQLNRQQRHSVRSQTAAKKADSRNPNSAIYWLTPSEEKAMQASFRLENPPESMLNDTHLLPRDGGPLSTMTLCDTRGLERGV